MNTKKYILLDVEDSFVVGNLKVRFVNGFTKYNVKEALDIKTNWTPLNNGTDKLYFFSGCTIPRFKVRELYSVSLKPENATALFLNPDALEGNVYLTEYKDLYVCNTNEIKYIIKNLANEKTKMLIQTLLDNNNIENVLLTYRLWYDNASNGILFNYSKLEDWLETSRYSYIRHLGYSLYSFKPTFHTKANIYPQNEILKELNKNNIVITFDKYIDFKSFADAGDDENLILLMELMSNSNFEKSISYLLFLFVEYGSRMIKLKEAHHVNFKSLMNFLNIKHENLSNNTFNLNEITNILKENKQFTRNNVMMLSSLFAGRYINYSDNPEWNSGPVLRKEYVNNINQ